MSDPYNLQRFVDAQAPVYADARLELGRGQKTGHWMWFIFPQLKGLGRSDMAMRFAISSKAEAAEYLRHSLLEPRLIECTQLVNQVEGRSIEHIFGYPDDLKFHSSMTLFFRTDPTNPAFKSALEKYFAGELDSVTEQLLR